MTSNILMRLNVASAALSGFLLRIFFVLKFPVGTSGDAPFYIDLAWNWLKIHIYGLEVNGQLTPVDVRAPGYPAFLAAIFAFAGNSPRAALLVQAVVDLGTCFLIALIAARWRRRKRGSVLPSPGYGSLPFARLSRITQPWCSPKFWLPF
jgi:hypothetical protein